MPLPQTRCADDERAGAASMFCEALSSVGPQAQDEWTGEVAGLLAGCYAKCEHVGMRQSQHPGTGSILRSGLRGIWSSEPLHPEAGDLAEHRGE